MSAIYIKPGLHAVLKELKGKSFTVDELTETYLSNPKSIHTMKKPARQYVYRNIQRLLKVGLMVCSKRIGRWPRYELSENFEQKATARIKPKIRKTITSNPSPQKNISVDSFKDRLSKHKSDMLCAMGEAEEYKELCREHPEICDEAQALYNEARERSAMLLGRVKAVEHLMAQRSNTGSQQ